MHILAAQSGTIADGTEAVDLAQSPGDIVVLSAADSELAMLARAAESLEDAPSLRLASTMTLGHNLSVDLHIENTAAHAKLIVLRLLGGASYWAYGLERLEALAREEKIALVVLPGGAEPDPELQARSTIAADEAEALRCYLAEGGPDNAANFLRRCAFLIGRGGEPEAARPLLKAGLYWPGMAQPSPDDLKAQWRAGAPVAAITFYRALIEGANLEPVDALIAALQGEGLNPLPVFLTSLKDEVAAETVKGFIRDADAAIVLNATGFAVASPGGEQGDNPLTASDAPVLQTVFSGSSREAWAESAQGMSARDLAMNVVLPELDGRVLSRAVSFKGARARHDLTETSLVTYRTEQDRIAFVAKLAANWVCLRTTPAKDRRVAIVLANYPNRDGRVGNGVGYDTPASTIAILDALNNAGYATGAAPADGAALMRALTGGPTNREGSAAKDTAATLPLAAYQEFFDALPKEVRDQVTARWGAPQDDPFVRDGAFRLAALTFGKVAVAIQPARGYNIDPKESYHDPALVPPHGYLAFHCWLRERFAAHAVVHNGKHGNLEWLPGKAVALSEGCFPEAALGPLPNIYPFIVNDPGEGSQAKRRAAAVIIDHLTPPLARAETYGPLKDLEALIDEYYLASGLDPRRRDLLRGEILDLTRSSGLDMDAGIGEADDEDTALQRLDAYICELKEAQIRDGLHVLGSAPTGTLETELLVALARVPRGVGEGGDASLIRALAADLDLSFDPLDCAMGDPWTGPRPDALKPVTAEAWRSNGDSVERLELLASSLVSGAEQAAQDWPKTRAVLDGIETSLRPALAACGARELAGLLAGLNGRFVAPGPSGAPTRGRPDVLPTGRNFFSVDNRAVPTPAAWTLGRKSAERLLERHFQDQGKYPAALGLSVWGTSNMRTGGDDIAQALALIGAAPRWDKGSWRVTGFDIIPLAKLARPRVDVTLRISGFFRDAFPAQIALFDSAVRAIAALEEDEADNPIAARAAREAAALEASGMEADEARHRAAARIFGSRPGAYGAGLQALIDEKLWENRDDLARSYLNWGSYSYGAKDEGRRDEDGFARRLSRVEAVVHNQDNREHDLLDSDDYYQFEGGMSAAVEHLSGQRPAVYHNDHSRPERPVIRTLEDEIGRVVRSRVVNPKWIAGVMRHGYKGAFEIAATVDYMFAFAATTGAVRDHHFELAYDAFIADETVRGFIAQANPAALEEISQRFLEALERGLWTQKSNAAYHELTRLSGRVAEDARA